MDITDRQALPADLSSVHSFISWQRQPISFHAGSGSLLGEAVEGPGGLGLDPEEEQIRAGLLLHLSERMPADS